MATTLARGTPEQTAATPIPAVSEAAPAAPSSSLQPSQESAAVEKAAQANSPGEIRALLSNLRKAPAPKPAVEGKPAAEAAPAPAVEEPATPVEEAAPESSEATPAESAAAPAAEGEGEEPDDDEGGEGPISPITGKRTHLRLSEGDKVGRLAASFMKRNRDMPMEDAVKRARDQLGIKPEKATETAEPAPKSDLPTTLEAVDSELSRIEAELKKAHVDLRFEDVADLNLSLRKLDRHRLNLERETERSLVKQESDYNNAYSASETKATELYPFAGDPESEGAKRMAEIDAALKENNDPLFSSPDKPLRVAQMVAAELKIAPKRKGSPVAPAKAAAPVITAPAPKKQILPSGGSRTIPPSANPSLAVAEEVKNISTQHDMRKFLKQLGKK